MKLWRKGIAMVLLAAMVLMMTPQSIDACTGTATCSDTEVTASCSDIRTISGGRHEIAESNGNIITCYITVRYGTHKIYCKTCQAFLGTENRTCSMTHSNSKYCTNRYNLCQ